MGTSLNGTQALERLMAGNRRYAALRQVHPRQTHTQRALVVEGQNPFAAIFSCSDSRVPAEIIFDQGLGDLFLVRQAGHVYGDLAIASLEFAIHALQVPLIMVMGHSRCGAVAGALQGDNLPGYIAKLVDRIRPAVEHARTQEGDLLENAIKQNSRHTMSALLQKSELLRLAVDEQRVTIVSSYYDLSTGAVEILT